MNPSFQRASRDAEIAELERLVRALREVARLAGQCADHARSRAERDRLLFIENWADEHLRRLVKSVPHEPDKLGEARIMVGRL
jgi:hypothetical protein